MKNSQSTCHCGAKRYGTFKLCFKHYREKLRLKKEERAKKKLERKLASKHYQQELYRKLYKKAWTKISEEVRKTGANFDDYQECYTCGKMFNWKEMNCGHFWHGKLDFDKRNLKPQCIHCNHHLSGNLAAYASRLIEENGVEWFNKLRSDAAQHQGYSLEEIKKVCL